jgi:hypothetical protein
MPGSTRIGRIPRKGEVSALVGFPVQLSVACAMAGLGLCLGDEEDGVPLLDKHKGHPSLRSLVADGVGSSTARGRG